MRSYKDLEMNYQSGDLDITNNLITSLDGCPQHITGDFLCVNNGLTSLAGGPQIIDKSYDCTDNQLTDLTGCASYISAELHIRGNRIKSFVGIHKIIKHCRIIYVDDEHVTEGGIGLLLIKNLEYISTDSTPFLVITDYLGKGTKGMMDCSKELISMGYTNYAKL